MAGDHADASLGLSQVSLMRARGEAIVQLRWLRAAATARACWASLAIAMGRLPFVKVRELERRRSRAKSQTSPRVGESDDLPFANAFELKAVNAWANAANISWQTQSPEKDQRSSASGTYLRPQGASE